MKRSKQIQKMIDIMNERSAMYHYDENEEGNSWLIFFLLQINEYKGFYNCVNLDGDTYIKII
ncbi:MAG: hypothetical protein J6S67_15795 [Methanobrevibacter sp.]|nr:hypothetical protein [Methanobrevibacter sp.]